jgi:hypothetical protein
MGRLDLLRAVQGGRVGLLSLWATFRLGNLHELPDTYSLQSLDTTWREWVEMYDVSSRCKQDRLHSRRRLGVTADHTVTDVPEIGYVVNT